MNYRYLIGPLSNSFAAEFLPSSVAAGACQTFDVAAGTDLRFSQNTTWEEVRARGLVIGTPNFIAVWLEGGVAPPIVWKAPVPLIGLVSGSVLRSSSHLMAASHFDVVLTDRFGVDICRKVETNFSAVPSLCGLGQSYLTHTWPAASDERDIDILFIGSLHPIDQGDCLRWLGRLGSLADRYNVVIRTGASEDDARELLSRAKTVFNHSEHGTCNRRVFEAVAAGALLLQERGNVEVAGLLKAGAEFVEYDETNLEQIIAHYLANDSERIAIASAAQRRAPEFSFEQFFTAAIESLASEWDAICQRAANRPKWSDSDFLRARALFFISAPKSTEDATLLADLVNADQENPASAEWASLRAAIAAATGAAPASLVELFERAFKVEPPDAVAGLSLAEVYAALSNVENAIRTAKATLAALDRPDAQTGDPVFYPPGPHVLRSEWERAGWRNAGDPEGEAKAKRALVRWHLHSLLATLTGRLEHYINAVIARPDLPTSRAALGCAFAREGRLTDAVPHLEAAVTADPFDRQAARALYQVLTDLRQTQAARKLARTRKALAKAAPQVLPPEPWFAEAPPVGDELASLIILCCNEVEVTRLCIDSVLKHTRKPYELILIDNGSTDGTPQYLDSLQSCEGPDRIVVIHNEQNRGYPCGVNQGLEAARGEFLILLNNDVVVTHRWLDKLVNCSLHDWPRVGLVGAVTNYAPPSQRINPGYTDLSGLDAFAAQHAARFAGQAFDEPRLTGFCLLIRRAAFDTIGKLDERFGLGFFDDDDLCLRARRAGFRLAVALDCYVHHFGSRTFRSLGIDTGRQLDDNLELYRQKWGNEEAARYKPVDAQIPPPPRRSAGVRPQVSLTMIVKNEEHHLPDCLRSVRDLVDEIVIVDTGSTDRTKEVAASFGARVFDFPWIDSFAAARNEALRHATGEWVLWMDADDRLDDANRVRAKALFDSLSNDNAAYVMKCFCLGEPGSGGTTVDHVRLFRNRPDIRWKYRVHEQILPGVRATKGDVRWADVIVTHVGYADPAARKRKLERDFRILSEEYREQPDDPFTLFNLGSVFNEMGRPADALTVLQRSLDLSHPHDSIVRKLYALIAQCRRQLGQRDDALAACMRGRELYPDDEELLFVESIIRREKRDFAGAEACLKRLITGKEGDHFGSVAEGLRGHRGRHMLATLYLDTAKYKEAEAEWWRVLTERPNYLPARTGLAEVYLLTKRWEELEHQAIELEAMGSEGESAAEALRARGKLERGEFASARWALGRAVRRFPESVPLWMLLSHAAIKEGESKAAEEALLEVLRMAPWHPEARFNLAVVRARKHLKPDEEITLTSLYTIACSNPSDLREHVPTLYGLAKQCGHVTEFGTRTGVSTIAFLYAQPGRLVCIDRVKQPEVDLLERASARTTMEFRQADGLDVDIDATDLLFIAAGYGREQLSAALVNLAPKVKRFIVLYVSTSSEQDLGKAAEELSAAGGFRIIQRDDEGRGLIVLERIA